MLPNVNKAHSICSWPFTRTRRLILFILLTNLPTLFSLLNSVNFHPIVSCNEIRLHLLDLRSIHHISYKITDFLLENSSRFILLLFIPPELLLQSIKIKLKVIMLVTYQLPCTRQFGDRFCKVHLGENIWSLRYRKLQSCSDPFTSLLTINILYRT